MTRSRALSSESKISASSVDGFSNAQSVTPPTSIGDSMSETSTSLKLETAQLTPAESTDSRISGRADKTVGSYNLKVLSGTAIYARNKFNNDPAVVDERGGRMRSILGASSISAATKQEYMKSSTGDGTEALHLQLPARYSTKTKRRNHLRTSSEETTKKRKPEGGRTAKPTGEHLERLRLESLTKRLSVLGKRSRKTYEDSFSGLAKVKRELQNLADTPEYAKIEIEPVVHEVWSNGKLVIEERPRVKKKKKKKKPKEDEDDDAEKKKKKKENNEKFEERTIVVSPNAKDGETTIDCMKLNLGRREKIWLTEGLYAGQECNLNWYQDSGYRKKKLMEDVALYQSNNKVLPMPMWHGQRLLQVGRSFKLPFDVCSPLPPGQPKPDEWRKTSCNRFVGDAGALWKKSKFLDSSSSKCVCTPETGCNEDCQNRIMFYECDETNCASGRDLCTNRAFAELQERRKAGGKFRVGVEVIKTADRGYGVRSNRCFEPHQIIVEYTGEIITEDECDRRMNEDYKDNDCYYLMLFDQSMIIDATKGSIARFVNHSCKPNCRMVKWIVGGKPRMALFVGDETIMTGDELTYDYNFDPFSVKNIQECRCGSDNCRGVLGPRPKDLRPAKESVNDAVQTTVKAGKRKIQVPLGRDEGTDDDFQSSKNRRKKGFSTSTRTRATKAATQALKKSLSSTIYQRRAIGTKRITKKTDRGSALKMYGCQKTGALLAKTNLSHRYFK